jgi:hypothetical protein
MGSASPEDDAYLVSLIRRTVLLPERDLRRHWERLAPLLPIPQRYALAAVLVELEQACTD